MVSFPAGLVEERESALRAAKRELLEETGYRADRWKVLGSCYPLPGLLDQRMHIFVAMDIEYSCEPKLDALEDIKTNFISLEDLCKLFAQGKNTDANALAAFGLFQIAAK